MANGKQDKMSEKITWEDFETYLPSYDFDEKQIQFFKETFDIIMNNHDTSKVTCFADRPGIGKSTFIKTLMHCCIGYDIYKGQREPIGLIIITDSMRRLEELSDGGKESREAEQYWGELFEEWGNKYHGETDCPSLKRTVYLVPLSEAGGRSACSKCG